MQLFFRNDEGMGWVVGIWKADDSIPIDSSHAAHQPR